MIMNSRKQLQFSLRIRNNVLYIPKVPQSIEYLQMHTTETKTIRSTFTASVLRISSCFGLFIFFEYFFSFAYISYFLFDNDNEQPKARQIIITRTQQSLYRLFSLRLPHHSMCIYLDLYAPTGACDCVPIHIEQNMWNAFGTFFTFPSCYIHVTRWTLRDVIDLMAVRIIGKYFRCEITLFFSCRFQHKGTKHEYRTRTQKNDASIGQLCPTHT